MFKKLYSLLRQSRELVAYLFFGVLTTAVNYLIYLPCYNYLNLSAGASNIVAWIGSVCVAFVTNKAFVFKSNDWSARTVWAEAAGFVGGRIVSGAFETAILFLTVDCLRWDGNLMKVLLSIMVVVSNYVISKWLVFRNKK